jgi:sugar diacid utilization regulator
VTWSDLQVLTDEIAERLGAPCIIEDEEQRTVVYSSHTMPIDNVRRDSILRRETESGVRDWFRQFGILESFDPIRIPRDETLGVLARLCVPIRYNRRLAGFMWFIDDEERLGLAEVHAAQEAAKQASVLMHEQLLDEQLGGAVLTQLLSHAQVPRQAAADQALQYGLVRPGQVWVVVVQPAEVVTLDGRTHLRSVVKEALRDLARHRTRGTVLTVARSDHGALLLQTPPNTDGDALAGSIAEEAMIALTRRLSVFSDSSTVVAGVGEAVPYVFDAYRSYTQARQSATVAAAVPAVGPVAHWRALGAYRVLARLGLHDCADALDPRVAKMLATAEPEVLTTLETYLDLGCDAQAAAAQLHLHRATLYYRLQKAEKSFEFNIHSGDDRLALHLGLRLARLAGLCRGQDAGGSSGDGDPA